IKTISSLRPQLSTPLRLGIDYGYCTLLLTWSTPYCGYFYQDPLYDNTTREVHDLTAGGRFTAFGGRLFASEEHEGSIAKIATHSILPTYFAAYGVFIWCNSTIHRFLNSFHVKLSRKTVALQRRFLIMFIMQSLLPLLVMAPPVIMFLFALTGGYALDTGTFLISFSFWAVPIVQGSVSLSFIMSASTRATPDRSSLGRSTRSIHSTAYATVSLLTWHPSVLYLLLRHPGPLSKVKCAGYICNQTFLAAFVILPNPPFEFLLLCMHQKMVANTESRTRLSERTSKL
ncbi:hypothetical protein PENTCL1PPCAC_25338, partial [Pristionchus entomophagus]